MLVVLVNLLCQASGWGATVLPVHAQASSVPSRGQACEAITDIAALQPAIDAADAGQTVCVRLAGDGGDGAWSLQPQWPLKIKQSQTVVIDCAGKDFSFENSPGILTMEAGSKLQYERCNLLHYSFPEDNAVYDTVHAITQSTIGFRMCGFVLDLNDQYAPTLAKLQSNASFETAALVEDGSSAAVHIFTAYFDSLLGPQIRYEVSNSTAYCGSKAAARAAIAEAVQRSSNEALAVIMHSKDLAPPPEMGISAGSADPGDEGGGIKVVTWAIATSAVIGVALCLLGSSLWMVRAKAHRKHRLQPADTRNAANRKASMAGKDGEARAPNGKGRATYSAALKQPPSKEAEERHPSQGSQVAARSTGCLTQSLPGANCAAAVPDRKLERPNAPGAPAATGLTTSSASKMTASEGLSHLKSATAPYGANAAASEAGLVVSRRRRRLTTELDGMRHRNELFLKQFAVLPWTERREGGQGVVQFMRSTRTEEVVAVKFFLASHAFHAECALYQQAVLRSMMPAVRLEVANMDGKDRNSRGYAWPPCIVLEKGESLQEWRAKSQPAFTTIVDALCLIAERLARLHGSGWVHRDLKPGNVLRLPLQHSWTLMDFGCAARTGASVPITFSASYTPPEVAQALECDDRSITADAAADVWALGVMAFELLTGMPVFAPFATPRETMWAQLCGRQALPWEEGAPGQAAKLAQLRALRGAVLQCLARRPEERPAAEQVLAEWRSLFDVRALAGGSQPT